MDIYYYIVIFLILVAAFDLMVGVSNDAVNFLNSSLGSFVAPRYIKAKTEERIKAVLLEGHGIRKTAKLVGAGVGTVHRIKRAIDNEVV